MKRIVSAPLAILIGYMAGMAYYTVAMLAFDERLSGDYWGVVSWSAVFSFTVGAALFLPAQFLIKKEEKFWRFWICGPFGAIAGFGAFWILSVDRISPACFFGGQAAVIVGITYLASLALAKKCPNQSSTAQRP